MVGSLLRDGTVGAALAVTVIVTIGLASTLTACASTTTAANGSPVGAAAGATNSTTATPSPPTSAPPNPSQSTPASINPGGPMDTPTVPSPSAVVPAPLTAPPAKSKYVPIDQETQSSDGRTLYLEIEARGGACGQYVVVLQQAASDVHVGLAQLLPRVGVMCPDYIAPRTFPVQLSSPVGTRAVIDLATGKRLGS